jgi:hypothetical protein
MWLPVIEKIGDLAPPYDLLVDVTVYGDIERAIVSVLTNDATVAALVGTRIYPLIMPQAASRPAITYQQIGGYRWQTVASAAGVVDSRFQLNCWGDDYADADSLADAVRQALDGYSGIAATVTIVAVQIEDEGDIIDMTGGLSAVQPMGKRIDFRIWFKESF